MKESRLIKVSKFLSLVLRHKPEKIGITLDENGWADTTLLISGLCRNGRNVSLDYLKEVVAKNDKQRFKVNDDYSKIRANQGHSVVVDIELKEVQPPDILYHGTATVFWKSIKTQGLITRNRLHVHLSADKETAISVGKRHGKPIVLIINATQMHKDGFTFYLSENGVWLVNAVPPKYISSQ